MAEAVPSSSETSLSRLLECAICLHTVTNHRALPCQHSFCQSCLEPMVTDQKLVCPICREVCKLKDKGVEGLPRNVMVMGLLDQLCASCRLRAREVLCPHCHKNICNVCYKLCQDHVRLFQGELVSFSSTLLNKANDKLGHIHEEMASVYQQVTSTSEKIDESAQRLISAVIARQQELKQRLNLMGNTQMGNLTARYQELLGKIEKVKVIQNSKEQEVLSFEDRHKQCLDWHKELKETRSSVHRLHAEAVEYTVTDTALTLCSSFGEISVRRSECSKSKCQKPPKRRHSSLGTHDFSPPAKRVERPLQEVQRSEADKNTDYSALKRPRLTIGGYNGGQKPLFNSPSHVAVSPVTGNLVVCDKDNSRIQVFTPQGQQVSWFGVRGHENGQFSFGQDRSDGGVAVTKNGYIVVADTGNHRLQFFTEHGGFVKKVGHRGSGQGQLRYPAGIACNDVGKIHVCDPGNQRVLVMDEDSFEISVFAKFDNLKDFTAWCPVAVAVCPNRDVAIVDHRQTAKIDIFSSLGLFKRSLEIDRLSRPMGVVVNTRGHFVLTADKSNLVYIVSLEGTLLHSFDQPDRGEMDSPVGVACSRDGQIVVVDQNNNRVLVF